MKISFLSPPIEMWLPSALTLLRLVLGTDKGVKLIADVIRIQRLFKPTNAVVASPRRLRKSVLDQGTDIRRHISAAPLGFSLQLGFQIRVHFDRDALGHFFCFAHLFVLSKLWVLGIRP